MSLYIYAQNLNLRKLLVDQVEKHRSTDSGFDIPMLNFVFQSIPPVRNYGLDLEIQVAATHDDGTTAPCLLLPRSSIGSTPFRITNSIGLIDQGYRGQVQAKIDTFDREIVFSFPDGSRLFQLCRHNFLPWKKVVIVDSLRELPAAPDNRGSGGFGSTGN